MSKRIGKINISAFLSEFSYKHFFISMSAVSKYPSAKIKKLVPTSFDIRQFIYDVILIVLP